MTLPLRRYRLTKGGRIMNNNRFLPETEAKSTYRFRPLRTVLVCLLIAAVLVSMSIGLSYAKYTTNAHLTASLKSSALQFYDQQYIVQERDRVNGNVFTTFDGKVKITVPADAVGANLTNADYLVLQKVNESYVVNYELPEKQYQYKLSYYLYGFTYSTNDNGFVNGNVVDDNKSITLAVKVGSDYIERTATPSAARTGISHAYSDDYVVFSGISKFTGAQGRTVPSTMDYNLVYDKASWDSDVNITLNYSGSTVYVSSADELAQVAYLVNNGNDFYGKTVVLTGNISLYANDDLDPNDGVAEKLPWTPIGTFANPFRGSFNGNGCTISGLNIRNYDNSVDGSQTNFAGLFGCVQDSDFIGNVNLSDIHISCNIDNVGGEGEIGPAIGALIGSDYGSDEEHNMDVSGVTVSGLTVTSVSKYLGGIMGYGLNGVISGCSVSGMDMRPDEASQVGGIIGLQHGRVEWRSGERWYVEEINVKDCYVVGDFGSGCDIAGGIIGQATNGAIGVENCVYSGSGADAGILVQLANTEFTVDGKLFYTITGCSCSGYDSFGGYYHFNTDGKDLSKFPVIQ